MKVSTLGRTYVRRLIVGKTYASGPRWTVLPASYSGQDVRKWTALDTVGSVGQHGRSLGSPVVRTRRDVLEAAFLHCPEWNKTYQSGPLCYTLQKSGKSTGQNVLRWFHVNKTVLKWCHLDETYSRTFCSCHTLKLGLPRTIQVLRTTMLAGM